MAISSISDLARVHGGIAVTRFALRAGDRTITYGELDERTNRVANALIAEGVEPQDRVAFLDKNGIEYFEVLFGAAKLECRRTSRSTGASRRPRSRTSSTTRSRRSSWSAPSSCPCSTRSRATCTTVKQDRRRSAASDGYERYEDCDRRATHAADPGVAGRRRRRRLPALLVGHDRPAQGRDAHERQPLRALPRWRATVGLHDRRRSTSSRCRCSTSAAAAGRCAGHVRRLRRRHRPRPRPGRRSCELIERHGITHAFLVPAVLQFMLHDARRRGPPTSRRCEMIVYGASPITDEVLADVVRVVRLRVLAGCTGSPRRPARS